jgi:hypothetical protein
VTVSGFKLLFTLPVKPVNWYPGKAVAVIVTCDPLLNRPLAGEIIPAPDGLTEVVR